ncbi:hypothetical protein GGR57DRAFT_292245 [Xylariaceae sp. FL1272]|nr:hypothetical protein GGR57DRAFT_292245 [Xylariaceae sp. FL1272]
MYSWVILITANILVESFWQALLAAPVFASWYYPTGLYRNGSETLTTTERGGLSFLLILLFNLWASTPAQTFVAGFGQAETAMYLVCLCLRRNCRSSGYSHIMSRHSHFLEGLAIAGLADTSITCSSVEVFLLGLPSNFTGNTCGQYLAPFVDGAGGSILNPNATGMCEYCSVTNVNGILAIFGMDIGHAWRNAGLMVVYIFTNLLATFAIYGFTRLPRAVGKTRFPELCQGKWTSIIAS